MNASDKGLRVFSAFALFALCGICGAALAFLQLAPNSAVARAIRVPQPGEHYSAVYGEGNPFKDKSTEMRRECEVLEVKNGWVKFHKQVYVGDRLMLESDDSEEISWFMAANRLVP